MTQPLIVHVRGNLLAAHVDFRGANLDGCNLSKTVLHKAMLDSASFYRSEGPSNEHSRGGKNEAMNFVSSRLALLRRANVMHSSGLSAREMAALYDNNQV